MPDWHDTEGDWDDEFGPEDDDEFDVSADEDDTTIPCPYCRRPIHEEAERCPHCEQYISGEDTPPAQNRGGFSSAWLPDCMPYTD